MALIRFSSAAALARWLRLVAAPLRRRSERFWTEVRGGRLLAGSISEDGAARVEVMLQVGDGAPDDVRRWHRVGAHPTSQLTRKSFDTHQGSKEASAEPTTAIKAPLGEVVTPPPELLRHPLAQKVDRQLPGLLSEIKHHDGRYTLQWAAEGVKARLQLSGDLPAPRRAEAEVKPKAAAATPAAEPPPKPKATLKPRPDAPAASKRVEARGQLPTSRIRAPRLSPVPGPGELDGKPQPPPTAAITEWRSATRVGKNDDRVGARREPRLAYMERFQGEDLLFWPTRDRVGYIDLYGLRVGVVPGAPPEGPSTVKLPLKSSQDVLKLLKEAPRHLDPLGVIPGGHLDSPFKLKAGTTWGTLPLSRKDATFLTEATMRDWGRGNLHFTAWMSAAGLEGVFGEDLAGRSMLWSTDGHRLHMLLLHEPAPSHEVHLFSRLTLGDAQGEVRYALGPSSLLALTRHTAVALDSGWRMPDVRGVLPRTWECFEDNARSCFKLTLTAAMVSELEQALRVHRAKKDAQLGPGAVKLIILKGAARLASPRMGGGATLEQAAVNTELPGWPAPEGLAVGFDARYVAAALDSIGACEVTIFDTLSPTLWRAGERAAVIMPLRV